MDEQLAAKLNKRNQVIEAEEDGLDPALPSLTVFNPYTEFKEFSRKEIMNYQKMFKKYDEGKDNFIDFEELKRMMEKLGAPQTQLALKEMVREVDEDKDGKISFREFLLIFRKAAAGEFNQDNGLFEIYRQLNEIDVDAEGVKGAKGFFEAKIDQQTQSNKFADEIRQEQEERRQLEEERKKSREAFKAKATFFKNAAS